MASGPYESETATCKRHRSTKNQSQMFMVVTNAKFHLSNIGRRDVWPDVLKAADNFKAGELK